MQTHLVYGIACLLVLPAFARPQDPLPGYASIEPLPGLLAIANDQLPGQDLPTLLPPVRTTETPSLPTTNNPAISHPDSADFDRNRLYLPDTNPGLRQPPCPCLPLGTAWISAEYLHAIVSREDWPIPNSQGETTAGFRPGLRVDLGLWIDRCNNSGIDSSLFYLNEARSSGIGQLGGVPILQNNSVSVSGAEVNWRKTLFCEDDYRYDLIIGYRYMHLAEEFSAASETLHGIPPVPLGSANTTNDIHTLQIGWCGEWRFGSWFLDATAKIGFGVTNELVDFHPLVVPGSSLAPQHDGSDRFTALPAGRIKAGYQLTDHARAFIGYDFDYASEVVRPQSFLEKAALGGTKASTDFWMQAIQIGLEARF